MLPSGMDLMSDASSGQKIQSIKLKFHDEELGEINFATLTLELRIVEVLSLWMCAAL